MKNLLIVSIGIILFLIPGGISALFVWSLVYPKHKKIILNKVKGDFPMIEKIVGKRNPGKDEELVKKINLKTENLKNIDESRMKAVDSAFQFVLNKSDSKSNAIGPALVVLAFGLGCALVGASWYLTTIKF